MMGLFNRSPRLPELPPFGAFDPATVAVYFGKHLDAHSHMFPSEAPLAWEGVRGWDLNEQPPHLAGPALVSHAVLTDRLLHFCDNGKGRLTCAFDFLLHMIRGVQFDLTQQIPGAASGTGLLAIFTPSGRTLLCCSGQFASHLHGQIDRAKHWAYAQGMNIA